MEKMEILESLGFSKDYLSKIEEFGLNHPNIAQFEFESPVTVIDFAPSQDLTIRQDPKTAYSNFFINI